jgi:hypothetical protein
MNLPKRQLVALGEPTPQVVTAIQDWVRRTCSHSRLQPSATSRSVYECADCGYQARASFGQVVRGRDDA